MCPTVIVLKAVVEMALLFYLAQLGVRILSFGRHEANPVYRAIRFLSSPFTRLGRGLVPGAPRHAPLLGFLLGLALWTLLVLAKRQFQCGLPS